MSESQSSFLDSDDMFSASEDRFTNHSVSKLWASPSPAWNPPLVPASASNESSSQPVAEEVKEKAWVRGRKKVVDCENSSGNNSDFSDRSDTCHFYRKKSNKRVNIQLASSLRNLHSNTKDEYQSDISELSDSFYHNTLTPSKKR